MKRLKATASLPSAAGTWSKEELGHYLHECLGHNLGPAVRSDLLPRQLESCCGDVRAAESLLDRDQGDEKAELDGVEEQALALLDDHIRVFFIVCQLYLTRVVETVRSFTLLRPDPLPEAYKDRMEAYKKLMEVYKDRETTLDLGPRVFDGMTVAQCMWHLGNFAKHDDELEEFNPRTREVLARLKVIGVEGKSDSGAGASLRGIECASGKTVESLGDVVDALGAIGRLLREWSDQLKDRLIGDVDELRYDGDRERTKRVNEVFRKAISQLLRSS